MSTREPVPTAPPTAGPTPEATDGHHSDGGPAAATSPQASSVNADRHDRLIPPPPQSRRQRRLTRIVVEGQARTDRFNRSFLILFGLILAAAGAAGLLLFNAVFTGTEPSTIYVRWTSDARGAVDASAAIGCAICLVVVVLGAWWALAQLRPVGDGERVSTIRVTRGPRGRTTMPATALTKAAGMELSRRSGVASARIRLRSVTPKPRLVAIVELELDADVGAAFEEIATGLAQVSQALGFRGEDAEAEIRLRFPRANRSNRVTVAERVT